MIGKEDVLYLVELCTELKEKSLLHFRIQISDLENIFNKFSKRKSILDFLDYYTLRQSRLIYEYATKNKLYLEVD